MMDSRLRPSIGENLVEILPRLRLYARSLVFSESDADDLVQKTCVRVLERQAQFQSGTSLIAWAITGAPNPHHHTDHNQAFVSFTTS